MIKATRRQSVLLLSTVASITAVLDQVAVLTLLTTEIVFPRKRVTRVAVFSAHRLTGKSSVNGHDVSREWFVVQRTHPQSHQVGTLLTMLAGLVLFDFVLLLTVAKGFQGPEENHLHPEDMLRLLLRSFKAGKRRTLPVEVYPTQAPLNVGEGRCD